MFVYTDLYIIHILYKTVRVGCNNTLGSRGIELKSMMTRKKSLEATRPKGKNTPKCMSEGVPKTKSRMKKGNNDLKKGKGNSMTTRVVKTSIPTSKKGNNEAGVPKTKSRVKKEINDLKKGKGNSMTTRVVKTETPCRKET